MSCGCQIGRTYYFLRKNLPVYRKKRGMGGEGRRRKERRGKEKKRGEERKREMNRGKERRGEVR